MKTRLFCMLAILALLFAAHDPGAAAQAAGPLPTLWIIGDSTVHNPSRGLQGWGEPIADFFDKSKITVVNRALGGRSSRTFLTEGHWDQTLAQIKPGDFVLMQFGHNDGGSPKTSYRASLKGVGDETETATDPRTPAGADPKSVKTETVHTYGWYLRKFVDDAKAKGATPIVLSPIPRNIWTDDNGVTFKVLRSGADYGGWAAQVAKAEGVPFIDLNALTADKYDALGPDKVKAQYFPGDHTHTSPAGALVNAASVVEGVRALTGCPLAGYLLPASAAPVAAAAAK